MNHWNDGDGANDAGGFSSLRVMLVGDDEPFLQRVAGLFVNVGHRSRLVADPRAALAAVGEADVDVLVCDLGATRLQSIATILALRALGDEAPPVVVISSMPNLAQHCEALHVEHFIAQPFRFSSLLEIVERVGEDWRANPIERSGVFFRQQVEGLIESLPDLEALSFG
jgi:two-component system OmpR family response regulator/two-component system response regulator QseB